MSTFFRLDAGASYPIYRGRTKLEEVVMRDFVFTTGCTSVWAKNRARPAIPCAA